MSSESDTRKNDMEDSLKIPNIDLLEECIELLNEGKTVLLTAKGDSMLPFIRDREKIILQKAETYRRGDIVLARTDNGTTVLHRIIRTGNGTATLMGDRNLRKKEKCPSSGIKGKVISISGKRGIRLTSSWRHRCLSAIWLCLIPVRRLLVKCFC